MRLYDSCLCMMPCPWSCNISLFVQVTFNSLIAACAQGAQWEKAAELFEQMHGRGCRPDPVTYGGLIAAYEKVNSPLQERIAPLHVWQLASTLAQLGLR